MTIREKEAMRENIITTIFFFSIVANIMFGAIMYAQAKNNKQLMEVLDKKGCIKAIENTPLPKLVRRDK